MTAPPEDMAAPRPRSTAAATVRPSPAESEPQSVAPAEVVELAAVAEAPAAPKVEQAEPRLARSAEPKPTNTAAPEPKVKAPEPKPAPIIQALAPSVRVEQTRWHPDPTRRTALLEVDGGSQEVREGDSLGALVVTKIEPSGVVFTEDGVELRRRIGE
jgi:hypothetical protein